MQPSPGGDFPPISLVFSHGIDYIMSYCSRDENLITHAFPSAYHTHRTTSSISLCGGIRSHPGLYYPYEEEPYHAVYRRFKAANPHDHG
jgi:hypothetical protein